MSETLYVIRIRSWDWPLHVGVRPRVASAEGEDDLMCVEGISIEGVIVEPEDHRGKVIGLNVMPMLREIIFGDREILDVGSLYMKPFEPRGFDLTANLLLPQDTLEKAIFCLGSIW